MGGPGAEHIEEKGRTSVRNSGAARQNGGSTTGLRPAAQDPPARGRDDPEVIPLPNPRQPTLLRGYKHSEIGHRSPVETETCRE